MSKQQNLGDAIRDLYANKPDGFLVPHPNLFAPPFVEHPFLWNKDRTGAITIAAVAEVVLFPAYPIEELSHYEHASRRAPKGGVTVAGRRVPGGTHVPLGWIRHDNTYRLLAVRADGGSSILLAEHDDFVDARRELPVLHYASYGPNATGKYDCGTPSDERATGTPNFVTCQKCMQLSPGLWPGATCATAAACDMCGKPTTHPTARGLPAGTPVRCVPCAIADSHAVSTREQPAKTPTIKTHAFLRCAGGHKWEMPLSEAAAAPIRCPECGGWATVYMPDQPRHDRTISAVDIAPALCTCGGTAAGTTHSDWCDITVRC